MHIFLTSLLLFATIISSAQDWNKKRCAVVLTYDDALNVHLDKAAPALDSLQLKATFYVTAGARGFTKRLADWKKLAAKGHELGNHTLFHPCTGNLPGRDWVRADYDLASYSVQRMTNELRMTNTVLESIDGKKQRTFAYPCGDTKIGDSAYLSGMKTEFAAARGVHGALVDHHNVNYENIDCFAVNGQTGEQLIAMVKSAMEFKSMIVFLFHGVGGEHSIDVSVEAHRTLLKFLKSQEKDIWITTLLDAVNFMKAKAAGKAHK